MACSFITESRFSSKLISRPGLSQQEKRTKKGGHGEQFKDQIQAAIACDLKRLWPVAEEFSHTLATAHDLVASGRYESAHSSFS